MLRVVLYHHIADHESDLVRGLNVTTSTYRFEQHLDHYARHYNVVSLDDVLGGALPPRALLITFDDAFRSVLDAAAPMLKQRGLPAVYFITPGCIQRGQLMLDHLINLLCKRVGAQAVANKIDSALGDCRSKDDLNRQCLMNMPYDERLTIADKLASDFNVDIKRTVSESDLYLTAADMPRFAQFDIEIANHSLNHMFCRSLDREALECEVAGAQELLVSWTGKPVRAFSVPYGYQRDLTDQLISVLRQTDHQAVCLAQSRRHAQPLTNDGLPVFDRVCLSDQSVHRLSASIEVLPRLRNWRERIAI